MCGHGRHVWMCGLMVAGALILLAVSGNPAALAPAVGCVLMMVAMMAVMSGHDGGGGNKR